MKVYEKLLKVQVSLKAPKSQFNSFAKYNFRNCEDILEAVKPLLNENKLSLIISDEVVLIGARTYIKATAAVYDIETGEFVHTTAYAREEETKKGQDLSQITGSASSYARKYALNGLFCIDDTKDSDNTNTHGKDDSNKVEEKLSEAQVKRLYAIANKAGIDNAKLIILVIKRYNKTIDKLTKAEYDHVCNSLEVKK